MVQKKYNYPNWLYTLMKPKLQPEILQGLKFADYRKFFYKELKRMKAGFPQGEQTEYLMLSEFEFADLKGKKIPLYRCRNTR